MSADSPVAGEGSVRADRLAQLRAAAPWDVLIIGGGATGLGCAVDAAARGYKTLLIERGDFASGTSSRSTKLIHGGVRYLRQGDLALVRHALQERASLLDNAPGLVRPLAFVIPARSWLARLYYAAGLKLYDLLAGARNPAASRLLDRQQTLAALPGLRAEQVCGGVEYHDAQFDDARLAIALMRTASDLGAVCLNYLPLTGLMKKAGRISGAQLQDAETGETFHVDARVVINATGVYADAVRRMDAPEAAPRLTHSQGIHLVLDADFLPGTSALLVPETADGRVMFAIPWLGKVLIGTTETERDDLPEEPLPFADEVDFLLRTAAGVLARPPQRSDIRSAFAGLRPLLDPGHAGHGQPGHSAGLSREHSVQVSESGLVTISGGKWTTYRWMAEQVVDQAALVGGLPVARCTTRTLKLRGAECAGEGMAPYGKDAALLLAGLPGHGVYLCAGLPYTEAMVRFACRYESARTIEDILARRTRLLFIDALAAESAIDRVGEILAEERVVLPSDLPALRERARACARRYRLG